jgi:hypothetical protein
MLVLGIILAAGNPTGFLSSKSDESAACEAKLIEAHSGSGFSKTTTNNPRTGNNTVRFDVGASR